MALSVARVPIKARRRQRAETPAHVDMATVGRIRTELIEALQAGENVLVTDGSLYDHEKGKAGEVGANDVRDDYRTTLQKIDSRFLSNKGKAVLRGMTHKARPLFEQYAEAMGEFGLESPEDAGEDQFVWFLTYKDEMFEGVSSVAEQEAQEDVTE